MLPVERGKVRNDKLIIRDKLYYEESKVISLGSPGKLIYPPGMTWEKEEGLIRRASCRLVTTLL